METKRPFKLTSEQKEVVGKINLSENQYALVKMLLDADKNPKLLSTYSYQDDFEDISSLLTVKEIEEVFSYHEGMKTLSVSA